jgi:hypothetical protein
MTRPTNKTPPIAMSHGAGERWYFSSAGVATTAGVAATVAFACAGAPDTTITF